MYDIPARIPFSKQYRYVTNHLPLYVTNYYIFVFTVTLLLLTMCFSLVNTSKSSNTTFTTIVVFHQISKGPMYLFHEKVIVMQGVVLMIRLANGLETKKIVYFLLQEYAGSCKES